VVDAGATVIWGHNLLVANLGYGLRLTSRAGSVEHVMLFDTGTEGAAFLRNCANLGIGLGAVEEISITHGHWDHMGALVSGEIPRVSSFEKGRSDHLCRPSDDADWEPDPLLMDERMVVAHVRGLGLVVFSACSKAGIVNVCTEVARSFPRIPIHAVTGGLHLGGVMERIIGQTVEALAPFEIRHHCRSLHRLACRPRACRRLRRSGEPVRLGTSYCFQGE
jgi:metal-dependent hydrolase (beta-lactamase superfamily II)